MNIALLKQIGTYDKDIFDVNEALLEGKFIDKLHDPRVNSKLNDAIQNSYKKYSNIIDLITSGILPKATYDKLWKRLPAGTTSLALIKKLKSQGVDDPVHEVWRMGSPFDLRALTRMAKDAGIID